MPNMNMDSLKALCKEIIEDDKGMNEDLLNTIEKLYEEALLAQFLQQRQAAIQEIHQRVKERSRIEPNTSTSENSSTSEETEAQKSGKFGDEVKVLPHPEGPPKPAKREVPTSQELVQEELRKVLEERTVEVPASTGNSSKKSKLNIGLNDRVAFVKQLFMGSQEDYQRVISQINTMDDYSETMEFIESVVKPDYDWSEVEETENRLLELIAHRFNR